MPGYHELHTNQELLGRAVLVGHCHYALEVLELVVVLNDHLPEPRLTVSNFDDGREVWTVGVVWHTIQHTRKHTHV